MQTLLEGCYWSECVYFRRKRKVITTAESPRNWFFGKKLTQDRRSCGKLLAENHKRVGFSSLQHGDNAKVWVIISRSSSRHADELRHPERVETVVSILARSCGHTFRSKCMMAKPKFGTELERSLQACTSSPSEQDVSTLTQ